MDVTEQFVQPPALKGSGRTFASINNSALICSEFASLLLPSNFHCALAFFLSTQTLLLPSGFWEAALGMGGVLQGKYFSLVICKIQFLLFYFFYLFLYLRFVAGSAFSSHCFLAGKWAGLPLGCDLVFLLQGTTAPP